VGYTLTLYFKDEETKKLLKHFPLHEELREYAKKKILEGLDEK